MSTETVTPLSFEKKPHEMVRHRVADLLRGEVLRPSSYDIRFIQYDYHELAEDLGEEFAEQYTAYQLYVDAHQNVFLKKDEVTPIVTMKLLRGRDESVRLFGGKLTCMVPLRDAVYELQYAMHPHDSTTVIIDTAIRLSRLAGGFYAEDAVLEQHEYENMRFDKKGFPPLVDWVTTLKMYALGNVPNEQGVIAPGSPILTAEHIYRQPLVPSPMNIEGINA